MGRRRPARLRRLVAWVYPRAGNPGGCDGVGGADSGHAGGILSAVLAGPTSQIVLCVFTAVNVALVAVKWRERGRPVLPADGFRMPLWVPVAGAGVSLLFVIGGG